MENYTLEEFMELKHADLLLMFKKRDALLDSISGFTIDCRGCKSEEVKQHLDHEITSLRQKLSYIEKELDEAVGSLRS